LSKFSLAKVFRSNPFNQAGYPMTEMNVNTFLASLGGTNRSPSGEVVNVETSLQTSTVWACLNLISTQIAINPLNLYQYDAKGSRSLAVDHDYFDLINSNPNPHQDAIAFRTAVQVHIDLTGNGYIEIQRDGAARVVALWHRASNRTKPVLQPNGVLFYETTDSAEGSPRRIEAYNMVHIMGMTMNGYIGLDPLYYFKGSIGAKLAMDKFAARFFANDATPSGILSTAASVKPEDKTKMREDWQQLQSGSQTHKTAILDNGLKYDKISATQDESQYLQTKVEVSKEIAAFFGVQGYAVGLLDKGIKANVEQQAQDLYNYCLRPRMAKWEKAFSHKLFSTKGRSAGRYFVEYDVFKLLHPDDTSLEQTITSATQNGGMTPNEGRALRGFNPVGPEGDQLYIQLNMQTLEQANSVVPVVGQPDTELLLEQEENSLSRTGATYRGLFKDGVQRVMKGNRDYKAVYRCLWPTLESISKAAQMGKKLDDSAECNKAVEKLIEGMEHRAKKWAEEDIESICSDELRRVAKSLIFAVNQDVANQKSRADVAQLEADAAEQESEDVE